MLVALLLFTGYVVSWAYKVPLGVVRPCANLAYFCYSEWDWLDQSLYVLYWPCSRFLPFGATHYRDRVFPRHEERSEESEDDVHAP